MEKLSILVVEDDKLAQKVMGQHLGIHSVTFAGDLKSAKRQLDSAQFHLAFIDLQLSHDDDCSGLKLIPLATQKGIYAVVMSGCDSEEMVAKAYDLGCKDFYAKGNEQANVEAVLAKFYQCQDGSDVEHIFARHFITEDPATKANVIEALKYASSDLPILILGPSGTGKTSLGRVIH
jgi:DNA-binding NtrC family response regulator